MVPYYTIEEIAEKSGLSRDQVVRLGFAGQLVFSVRKHTPQNYKDVEETRNSDDSRDVRTRTKETQIVCWREFNWVVERPSALLGVQMASLVSRADKRRGCLNAAAQQQSEPTASRLLLPLGVLLAFQTTSAVACGKLGGIQRNHVGDHDEHQPRNPGI